MMTLGHDQFRRQLCRESKVQLAVGPLFKCLSSAIFIPF